VKETEGVTEYAWKIDKSQELEFQDLGCDLNRALCWGEDDSTKQGNGTPHQSTVTYWLSLPEDISLKRIVPWEWHEYLGAFWEHQTLDLPMNY
jgi:hypothetical protein